MLTNKKLTLFGAAAVWLALSPMAQAATYSDTGAAVLVWPKIVVDDSRDTVLQITNQSSPGARRALLLRQRQPALREHRRRVHGHQRLPG